MQQLKLSIIMPVYNSAKYLKDCIDSIIQNQGSYELIIVDDGSTDTSSDICKEYMTKYNNVSYFRKENGGVSSARNQGLKMATGEYVMFVDSDDLLDDGWIKIIDQLENDDIYYFDSRISINENKDNLLHYIIGKNNEHIFLSGPYCKAFKTSFLKTNNITFEENIINGEDMLFNLNCLLLSQSYTIFNFAFYNYRISAGQATKSFNKKIIESDMLFHQKLKEILQSGNISSDVTEDIINFCKKNAVFTILNRISYIKNYKLAKQYYYFLNIDPYNGVVNSSGSKGLVFRLCRKKQYFLLYLILKIRNRVCYVFKMLKKEYYKKI